MRHLLLNFIARLSVARKLILIYALDLSAVIFVSTILINEKFIAIDFARKEIVGNEYIGALRRATRGALTGGGPRGSADAVLEAEGRDGSARGDLGSSELAQTLAGKLRRLEDADSRSAIDEHAVASALQALITRIGNQSNLILDPDLDSYSMSLVVLRLPELVDLIGRIRDQAQTAAAAPGRMVPSSAAFGVSRAAAAAGCRPDPGAGDRDATA